MKRFCFSFIAILTIFFNCHGSKQAEQSFLSGFSIGNVLKELTIDAAELGVSAWVVGALATIVHEWGHALAVPMVFEPTKVPQVHIGTNDPDKDESLKWFSIGRTHFYKTFPWFGGLTQFAFRFMEQDKWVRQKKIFYTAAGGASAAIFLYSALTAMMAYCSYHDGKNAGPITMSLKNAFSPFSSILETQNLSFHKKRFLMNLAFVMCVSLIFNISYGLFPLCKGDGMNIWEEEVGLSDTKLSILHKVTVVGFAGCLIWLMKCLMDENRFLNTMVYLQLE